MFNQPFALYFSSPIALNKDILFLVTNRETFDSYSILQLFKSVTNNNRKILSHSYLGLSNDIYVGYILFKVFVASLTRYSTARG